MPHCGFWRLSAATRASRGVLPDRSRDARTHAAALADKAHPVSTELDQTARLCARQVGDRLRRCRSPARCGGGRVAPPVRRDRRPGHADHAADRIPARVPGAGQQGDFTCFANFSGCPAVTIPMGITATGCRPACSSWARRDRTCACSSWPKSAPRHSTRRQPIPSGSDPALADVRPARCGCAAGAVLRCVCGERLVLAFARRDRMGTPPPAHFRSRYRRAAPVLLGRRRRRRLSLLGRALRAARWSPALSALRGYLFAQCEEDCNSVLCNLYRDGHDSMGWHSDDEAELGAAPVILSFSFGGVRRFRLRHRKRPDLRLELELPSGSLLRMAGATQRHYRHDLPRTSRPVPARINLTFRRVCSHA